jgi:predicted site-specific integrase-resolvase
MAVKRASEKSESGKVFGHRRKAPEMFRVGLYARVSTQDQQTIPLQMRAMREYAAARGWTITIQVKEVGSGASERELRQKLMDAARRPRSISFWCGGWTGGDDHCLIWSPHSRN